MHRQALRQLLQQHVPADNNERAMHKATLAFVDQYPDCFERSLLVGHVTGSAWIVSPDRQQTLLIHHRKLDRWLQPGGHADGDPNMVAVSMREAQEETGLTSLLLAEPCIFDIDVHTIPARNGVPEHLHYDVRFLLEADPGEPLGTSSEIKNIGWFSLDEATNFTDSESILRLIRKTAA